MIRSQVVFSNMIGKIYMITSPSQKKYIGQTTDSVEKRWDQHKKNAYANRNKCVYIERAIRKYGIEKMNFDILLICPKDELDYYETKFIEFYNTLSPNGYNLTTGGKNNFEFCNEIKEKMSLVKIGDKNPNYGLKMSNEQKQKISDGKKFKKRSQYTNLPKYIYHFQSYNQLKNQKVLKEGYLIKNHPLLKNKAFCSMNFSMEEKLDLALEYIRSREINAVQRLDGNGSGED